MKHIKNCNHCNVSLTEHNWGNGNVKKQNYICKPCDAIKSKTNRFKRIARTIGQAVYGKYNSVKQGHVYIVSNPAWEGWYKVGMAVDADDRCRSYQTSSPMRDFKLEYFKFFDDRRNAENIAHLKLSTTDYEKRGEWFNAPLNKIVSVIKNIQEESNE